MAYGDTVVPWINSFQPEITPSSSDPPSDDRANFRVQFPRGFSPQLNVVMNGHSSNPDSASSSFGLRESRMDLATLHIIIYVGIVPAITHILSWVPTYSSLSLSIIIHFFVVHIFFSSFIHFFRSLYFHLDFVPCLVI